MIERIRGFTLIEILIVISVVGILSTIVAVNWSGAVTTSNDRAREQDLSQWVTTFDLYKSRYLVWPSLPTSDTTPKIVCLGAPPSPDTTPNTKCGLYAATNASKYRTTSDTNYTSLKTEVEKVGNFPKNNGNVVRGKGITYPVAGPLILLSQTTSGSTVNVTGIFFNFFEGSCPSTLSDLRTGSFATNTNLWNYGGANPNALLVDLPAAANSYPSVCGTQVPLTYTTS